MQNRAPVAGFTFSPPLPSAARRSRSPRRPRDPDGTIAKLEWDPRRTPDGHRRVGAGYRHGATKSFPRPGTYTIRIEADRQPRRGTTIASTRQSPWPTARRSPTSRLPGAAVEGEHRHADLDGADPDGTLAAQAWDLDNDGSLRRRDRGQRDRQAPSRRCVRAGCGWSRQDRGWHGRDDDHVDRRPVDPPPPRRDVSARGRDAAPPSSAATRARSSTSPLRSPTARAAPDPGPITGRRRPSRRSAQPVPDRAHARPHDAARRAAQLLTVRAPHGALARVRCKGRGCPAKLQRKKFKTKSQARQRDRALQPLERFLPAGVELQVSVTKHGHGRQVHAHQDPPAGAARAHRPLPDARIDQAGRLPGGAMSDVRTAAPPAVRHILEQRIVWPLLDLRDFLLRRGRGEKPLYPRSHVAAPRARQVGGARRLRRRVRAVQGAATHHLSASPQRLGGPISGGASGSRGRCSSRRCRWPAGRGGAIALWRRRRRRERVARVGRASRRRRRRRSASGRRGQRQRRGAPCTAPGGARRAREREAPSADRRRAVAPQARRRAPRRPPPRRRAARPRQAPPRRAAPAPGAAPEVTRPATHAVEWIDARTGTAAERARAALRRRRRWRWRWRRRRWRRRRRQRSRAQPSPGVEFDDEG